MIFFVIKFNLKIYVLRVIEFDVFDKSKIKQKIKRRKVSWIMKEGYFKRFPQVYPGKKAK